MVNNFNVNISIFYLYVLQHVCISCSMNLIHLKHVLIKVIMCTVVWILFESTTVNDGNSKSTLTYFGLLIV